MNAFKHSVILFIAATILFQQAALSQLLKLPLISKHYSEHHAKDRSITFSRFLADHYLADDHDDSDNDKDHQLPFKSFPVIPDAEAVACCTDHLIPGSFPSGDIISGYSSADPSGIASCIWQPPRC